MGQGLLSQLTLKKCRLRLGDSFPAPARMNPECRLSVCGEMPDFQCAKVFQMCLPSLLAGDQACSAGFLMVLSSHLLVFSSQ